MTYRVIQWATGQVGMPALRGIIDDLCAILASGKNVVNNSITRLVHPAAVEPETIKRLQRACEQGGSTLFNTGIHPGVVSDAMLFALTSLAQRIDSISAAELLDCSCYDPVVIHALGFGKTVEQDAAEFDTAILHYYWGPVISALAESFRLELDEIRVFRITAENYEKSRPEVHPEGWPMFPIHHDRQAGGYRILVRGEPDMQLDLAFGGPDPLVDVLASTGMAAVNAIPAVCAAPTGILRSFEDLPHLRGHMGRPAGDVEEQ